MRIGDLPNVGDPFEGGAEDQVFDSLLLLGPIIIVLIAIVGRSALTTIITVAYLSSFVGYVLYRGAHRGS
ncbi:hypothetical protein HALLA_00085 (plasmid) [Halostagnicola larsenii XH-48]|uniref:Uncharacterized protein n=1 Tax=Halostagnicola larsenii XH-48 TaxID=797299 RepID=W0JSS8_9EURY|nr:hypothetical protein [Halostagnicola larsenii]AHG01721.1 hypothetical protein HALLA_00085 [Halostagnicola larsenii XH-48]